MSSCSRSGVGTTPTAAEVRPRHAGVVGSPIEHSLSPTLHRAAYDALGLPEWTYHREEVRSGELTAYLHARPADWVGLSVTMPAKEEALSVADEASTVALLTGAANTLVRTADGWRADNTDVEGIRRSFLSAGVVPGTVTRGLVVGSGSTARSALVALHGLGVREVVLSVRDQPRPAAVLLGTSLGLELQITQLDTPLCEEPVELAVSTIPALDPGTEPAMRTIQACVALDVVYHPWPTPWSARTEAAGARIIAGQEMLLHQAARQVELMTGCPAPVAAMRKALHQVEREQCR